MTLAEAKNYLGQELKVTIDRVLGSKHPKHDFIYEANYGFLPGTMAPDGEELDAYVLGVDRPLTEFAGRCIAVIHRLNDDDDKLVIAPIGQEDMSDEAIRSATDFQEKYFQSEIWR